MIQIISITTAGAKMVIKESSPLLARAKAESIMTKDRRSIREVRIMDGSKLIGRWRSYTHWQDCMSSDKQRTGLVHSE